MNAPVKIPTQVESINAASELSPTLRAELGKLNEAQILNLLGEIVEPSWQTPFDINYLDEQFQDALLPVEKAYQAAYPQLARFAEAAAYPNEVAAMRAGGGL